MRTTDLNMAPLGDPVTAIVRSAQPHNVDTVVIDGRILKRDGRLTALDADEVVAQAAESLAGLRLRANLESVPQHGDFDRLDCGHSNSGRCVGSTSTSMLRATLGCRLMNPARSSVSTIW